MQLQPPPYTTWATTYYGPKSGIGWTITSPGGPRRVGLIGLGTGTLALYGRPGDTFRFYEIDPAILDVARNKFRFLQESPAKIETVLGDARLSLEAELREGRSQQFDLLVLDAFNGDAIPIHLLTQEAMALYRRHLRPGGLIAVHISNRHLNLQPAVKALAGHNAMAYATVLDVVQPEDWWLFDSRWMILSDDADWLRNRGFLVETPNPTDAAAHWTDDHASLFSALTVRRQTPR
jgi:SAM-dependent methyltransferase